MKRRRRMNMKKGERERIEEEREGRREGKKKG
jgi:hypothetical protein